MSFIKVFLSRFCNLKGFLRPNPLKKIKSKQEMRGTASIITEDLRLLERLFLSVPKPLLWIIS